MTAERLQAKDHVATTSHVPLWQPQGRGKCARFFELRPNQVWFQSMTAPTTFFNMSTDEEENDMDSSTDEEVRWRTLFLRCTCVILLQVEAAMMSMNVNDYKKGLVRPLVDKKNFTNDVVRYIVSDIYVFNGVGWVKYITFSKGRSKREIGRFKRVISRLGRTYGCDQYTEDSREKE